MKTILESVYQEAKRPYSQNELKDKSKALFYSLRLGNIMARHKSCGHFYAVKQNSKKEKEISEMNTQDVGKCSVCWKINKTPLFLHNKAQNLAIEYSSIFFERPKFLTYSKVDLENSYYKWLYEDFN